MSITEKLKKIKRELIQEANEGLKKIKGSSESEAAKAVAEQASGLKGLLVSKGGKFLKTYLKENVTQDNPTGATIGAFGEYVVKQTAAGIKKGLGALQNYLESESNNYRRQDIMPELEVAREILATYADDKYEQGREDVAYNGIEMMINKTEKELSLNLKRGQKTIELTYLAHEFWKKGSLEVAELNKDFGILTEDLLTRLEKLSDPAIQKVEKKTTLKIPQTKGEATYFVSFKKENGAYEVSYASENKKNGIMLKYVMEETKNGKEL